MSIKVLVTGGGALLGQGIIRALRRSSLEVEIVAVDPDPRSPGLFWADRAHLVPLAGSADYVARVRDLLEYERPDVVLVGTDVELPVLAAQRQEWERDLRTRILVSDRRVIEIADDKYETFLFLKSAGFDHPASCLPGEEDALVEAVGFPLVVKPRVGARSVGVSLVHDRDELARASRQDGVIIQEHIGSLDAEFTAGALVFDGMCEAAIVMRRDLRDGNTYRAYAGPFPDLVSEVRRLGQALQPYGPANFQFRVDAAGRIKVFEINARFSGTTPLRAHAGFNEVEMCLRRIVLGEPVNQPEIEEMVILRHWSETVVRPEKLAALE